MATLTGELLYARFGFETFAEVDEVLPDGNVMKVRRLLSGSNMSPPH